jgi:PKD repeat protein
MNEGTRRRCVSGWSRTTIVLVSLLAFVVGLLPSDPATAVQVEHDNLVNRVPVEWSPNVLDGHVYAIVEVGDRTVIGGTFTEYQQYNQSTVIRDRPYLFAIHRSTGVIDQNFRPLLDGEVQTLAPGADGRSVYVGGNFRAVNGTDQRNLVKLDLTTGTVDPTFEARAQGSVLDMIRRGDRLFVGGAFSAINGVPRTVLAELDAATGEVREDLDLGFSGHKVNRNGSGRLSVLKLDVTPDGSTAVVIGNFGSVDGQQREQIALIDLLSRPARLHEWHTREFRQRTNAGDASNSTLQNWCATAFSTYMRNVDISPDGSYFVVVTTGAAVPPRLCDTASKWRTDTRGSNLQPEWVNFAGGDTFYGVGITGPAVYTGGHMRWFNNPEGRDTPGPGAVPREGIGALDPRNGMPLSWDPGRARGVGVFEFTSTDAGLWIGHDTNRVAWRQRPRATFFPNQAGTMPADSVGPIPGDLYSAPPQGSGNPAILHRVNVGGPQLFATDGGRDWGVDTAGNPSPYRVGSGGGNIASYTGTPVVDDTVPSTTPREIFNNYRWDPPALPEMRWAFPVEAGRRIAVRTYFRNAFEGTSQPGQRIFDLVLDGETVLPNYDIVADAGHLVGTMKQFDIISDGSVDLEFIHRVENPLVNAIEIIDLDLADAGPGDVQPLTRRSFDGASFGPDGTAPGSGHDWSLLRGAFMLSGTLYTGWADGKLYAQTFNGSTFGPREELELYGLTGSHFPIAGLTSMAYDEVAGRLYYTVAGQNNLYYRGFTHESQIVGPTQFTAVSGTTAGINFSAVRGMHLDVSRGHLYVGSETGELRRVDFAGGRPVAGTVQTLSGPTVDGRSWDGRGLFTYAASNYRAPNVPPVAKIRAECELLTCRFASTGSFDPDGWIGGFSWATSAGGAGSDAGFEHTFAAQGTYEVTLRVTDNRGASSTETIQVSVADPVAVMDVRCDALECTFDGSGSYDVDDGIVTYEWSFGDGATGTGSIVDHTYAGPGTFTATLTVVDDRGLSGSVSRTFRVGAPRDEIVHLGTSKDSGNRSTYQVTVPTNVRGGDSLLLWVSSNKSSVGQTPPSGVEDWTMIDTVLSNNNLRTTLWHKVAAPGDEGQPVNVLLDETAKTEVALLAYGGTDATNPIDAAAGVPETVLRASHTTPQVVASADDGWVVSYWADRTSSTETWQTPSGERVRYTGVGIGPGRVSAIATDSGPANAGVKGGITATADTASRGATMWTVALAPRGFAPEATAPVADLSVECEGLVCDFSAAGSVAGSAPITDYVWSLGDGTNASGVEVSHSFAEGGNYSVSVTVTDADGLTSVATTELTVATRPVAAFDVQCEALSCTFDGSASSGGAGELSYEWEFSDDTTLAGATVDKVFAAAGSYDVTLTVSDTLGEVGTATATVAVADAVDGIELVGVVGANRNQTSHQLTIPADVAVGDGLVMVASVASDVSVAELLGDERWEPLTDVQSGTLRTWAWQSTVQAGDAGSITGLRLSATSKTDLSLYIYRGTSPEGPVAQVAAEAETINRAEHTTPLIAEETVGATVLSYWADRSSSTDAWIPPNVGEPRYASFGVGGGRVGILAVDDHAPIAPYGGLTAQAVDSARSPSRSARATMVTFVLRPS